MKSSWVEKLWSYLTGVQEEADQTIVVGIGGGEVSGKNYLAAQLTSCAEGSIYHVITFPLDGYLRFSRDQRRELTGPGSPLKIRSLRIGDHPDNFDFQRLRKDLRGLLEDGYLNTPSQYDYTRGCVVHDLPPFHTADRTIILVEGIFALHSH